MRKIVKSETREKPQTRELSEATAEITPWWGRFLVPFLVVFLTIVAFLPALRNGFVNWDDPANLLENPNYRGLGWIHLLWMFTTFHLGLYGPLTWVTFGLDYLLWGMNPLGYHLTSLLLHAVNTGLVYFLSFRLFTLSVRSSAATTGFALRVSAGVTALLFAIHPLRVEAVAGASARNHVLSALFLLLCVLCYLRYATSSEADRTRPWWLTVSIIVYGLSLLSNSMGMTLPMVLLVLDVYPLSRLGAGRGRWFGPSARRVWLEKLLFLVLAVPFGIIALIAKQEAGGLRPFEDYPFLVRASQAAYGLAFYLWKTVLPLGLSPLYEVPYYVWSMSSSFILSGIAVTAISLSLFLARRRWPAGLACWVCYIVILSPVLGIFQAGGQFVADRYSYLSCLGWAVLSGAGLAHCCRLWLRESISPLTFKLTHSLAAGIIFLLAAMTWQQAQVWHDSERLWSHAVAVAPGRRAHNILGFLLAGQGRTEEAIEHYRRLVDLDPSSWKAHNDLALLLGRQGRTEEAVGYYRSALQINPSSIDAHYNLGMLLVEQKEFSGAIEQFREVLRLSPDHAEAHFSLGTVLANLGRLDEAADHLQQAVKIKPDFAGAHHNLGQLLAARGDLKNAIDHFRQAVNLEPDFADAHESLGRALVLQGKKDEAARHLQEALRMLKSRGEAGKVP